MHGRVMRRGDNDKSSLHVECTLLNITHYKEQTHRLELNVVDPLMQIYEQP